MNTPISLSAPRWDNYILVEGNGLVEFYNSHLGGATRNVCFVIGKGFDPRMCSGLRTLLEAGGKGQRDVTLIEFDEGSASSSNAYASFVENNMTTLRGLVPGTSISSRTVQMFSEDRRRTTSRSAEGLFVHAKEFETYSDIVVDVSALPRSIYYPMIAKLLHLIDSSGRGDLNLHVLVNESPALDAGIQDEGPDESADYIHPFRGGSDREAAETQPRIWIPILGEGQEVQLRKIYELIHPDEISPVMPSPSINPRRGDNLIYEYRRFLFDELRIEPRNIIYAAERNPFEAYRQLRQTIHHYQRALAPLGGCRAVLSAVSTKLLSLGALLVAYELKLARANIGIAHVESQGYRAEGPCLESLDKDATLFGMVLTGEYCA